MKLVKPKVFKIGATEPSYTDIRDYFLYRGCDTSILDDMFRGPLTPLETLCVIYAKLCYKSLDLSTNPNLTKVREAVDNFIHVIESGHHSIFEHVTFNFIVTDCSRVFTHEQVRHRIGVAYSQTSGRYCNLCEEFNIVTDNDLPDILGDELTDLLEYLHTTYVDWSEKLDLANKSFAEKKRLTSALRRYLVPSGIANELGMSLNLRAVRHIIELRTSRHAEWEIRDIYNQIYEILNSEYPYIFADATSTWINSYREITFKGEI
jgi:thymidylate synthase (FAD)